MDVKVEVNSFRVSLTGEMTEAVIAVVSQTTLYVEKHTVSLSFAPIVSVGGHSISAVTPDFNLLGGLAVAA
jgi:hypothetical protein